MLDLISHNITYLPMTKVQIFFVQGLKVEI
jgi:hypothetical protein